MRCRAIVRVGLVSVLATGTLAATAHVGASGATNTPLRLVSASSTATGTVAPSHATSRSASTEAHADDDHHHGPFNGNLGGPVEIDDAQHLLGGAGRLGDIHADPMPTGSSLAAPTGTGAIVERSDIEQAARSTVSRLQRAMPTLVPAGAPGIPTLAQHVAPSCSGTGSDGNRVQVLYVRESDSPSRFTQVLPVLRNEVANVDDVFALSAAQTGGVRRVRWVHDSACAPVIKQVVVPDGSLGNDFSKTIAAVQKAGYTQAGRKYLMFADANQFCGIGTLYDDERLTQNYNDGLFPSYSRVDVNCWSSGHSVAAHELTHNLGGVQPDAPHATKNGHCFDESDLMCYDDGSGIAMQQVCPSSQEQLLDCDHDDYFSTNPPRGSYLATHWNTADSSFLDSAVGAPPVSVTASRTTAQTGDLVTFTARRAGSSTSNPPRWTWRISAPGCTLTSGVPGQAQVRCSATVSGTVTVTATATGSSTSSGSASISVTRSAAPDLTVTVPSSARAGARFAITALPRGKAPFRYSWSAGSCTVAAASSSTDVTCPATKAVGPLPVSLTVTQADGQRVTAAATVDVTAARSRHR